MKLIQGGLVVTQEGASSNDVLIDGEKIYRIGRDLGTDGVTQIVDATGCIIFPGFIDPHTHFAMTNAITTTCDDYASGSTSAICGGTTTVVNFASPKLGEHEALRCAYERERSKADGNSLVDYRFHMEIIEASDAVLAEIDNLAKLGVASLKVYRAYSFALDDKSLIAVIARAKQNNLLLEAHAEDGALIKRTQDELTKQGATEATAHPKTRPAVVESESIFRLASYGNALQWPVHIVHLSSKLGMETLRFCRQQGYAVTAETCPQYLWLDEALYAGDGVDGLKVIMAPPLRHDHDRKALLQGLMQSEISTLATDHCAYTMAQKLRGESDYRLTPGGAPGVETRAQLMYTLLVHQNGMALESFADLMATNAAKMYQMYPRKGVLQCGADADIVIYDPQGQTQLAAKDQHSQCDYTPFDGIVVQGKVRDVFLRGNHVLANGALVAAEPTGEYVYNEA